MMAVLANETPTPADLTGLSSPTITQTADGVTVSGTAPFAVTLDTGLTDARVFCQFYLTGFDGTARFSGGIFARGSLNGSNFRGYMLPSINLDPDGGGGYSGQTRYFTDNSLFSNRLNTPDVTLPGTEANYTSQLVNLECEIVGRAYQTRVWLASEPLPNWQVTDADIGRSPTASEFYWSTGEFGFVASHSTATVHITYLTAAPITELS